MTNKTRNMTEHERSLVRGDGPKVAGVVVRTEEDVDREARKGTPARTPNWRCGMCEHQWHSTEQQSRCPSCNSDEIETWPQSIYRILAHRTGGSVAGPAVAWAKRNSEIVEFATLEEAEAQAREWNDRTTSPNVFYTVRKVR